MQVVAPQANDGKMNKCEIHDIQLVITCKNVTIRLDTTEKLFASLRRL